ncbi:hypothetical protein [Methylacidimicrobium tartarophylax]|uniref:Uncharacterized protein n=1 Tax=Methylacidimicrobium tartarophylax TaxID=1041768 RepID=A0A5E6MI51_9BACT|nr:hypothetical protein [Methylacidimicrobium tartarophylax]VVM07589.1 hypothetical protein MAMT_01815 [Methylacidimicrobium tartarophylax]
MNQTVDAKAEIIRMTQEIDGLKDKRAELSAKIRELDTLRSNLAAASRAAESEAEAEQ